MLERKNWICNPYKNKTCEKTICGILSNSNISNPHKCFLTGTEKNRLEPSDPDKTEYADFKERIEQWLKIYYGREEEIKWRSDIK